MNDGGPHPSIQPPPAHLAGQQQAQAGGRSSPYPPPPPPPANPSGAGLQQQQQQPSAASSSSSSAGGPPALPSPYGPPTTHYQQPQQQQPGGWGGQHPQQAHPHHPQQQQQHYYPSQQPPPPPLAHRSDPYNHHGQPTSGGGGGAPPGLQGFTSQPPPRAPVAGAPGLGSQPTAQLVRNVQTRGGGQQQQHAHHQQQQQGSLSHSPSPYHDQHQQQHLQSPALGGWQGPQGGQGGYHPQQQQQQQHYPYGAGGGQGGYGPPPGQHHPHPHHPLHHPQQQQQQQLGAQGYGLDLKPNVGITPPSSTGGPPARPDSAATSRLPPPSTTTTGGGGGGAPRPARTAAAEKRAAAAAAKLASGGGKAGKGSAQGSDDDDADEGESTTGGGGAPASGGRKAGGQAGGNGPSDFVKKLFKMLGDEEYADVVAWSAAQDSFIVKDMNEFTTRILPQTFRHSNFASFVRQLNKYDFHKVKAEEGGHVETTWEFKHPQFNSRSGSELDLIKRKIPVPKKAGGGGASGVAGSGAASGGALAKELASTSAPLTTSVPLVSNGNGGFVPLDQGAPGSAGGPLGPSAGLGPPPLHLQPHHPQQQQQQQQQHPHQPHNGSRLSAPPSSAPPGHFPGGGPPPPHSPGQPSPYGPSPYPPQHTSVHPQAPPGPYGGPPPSASDATSAGAMNVLQEQVRELQAGQAAMFQHVQTLHSKYQKIIGDLVALQRSSTSTEALVGDVVNYLVQMENEQRVASETFTPASSTSEPSTAAASTPFRPSYGVSPLPSDPIESGAAVSPTALNRFPDADNGDKGKARENGLVGSGIDIDVPQGWEPTPGSGGSSNVGNVAPSGPPSSNGPSSGISASLIDPSLRGGNEAEAYPHPTTDGAPGGEVGGDGDSSATAPFGLSETLFAEFVPGGSFSAESITGTKRSHGEGIETPGAGDADDDADEGGGKRFRSEL